MATMDFYTGTVGVAPSTSDGDTGLHYACSGGGEYYDRNANFASVKTRVDSYRRDEELGEGPYCHFWVCTEHFPTDPENPEDCALCANWECGEGQFYADFTDTLDDYHGFWRFNISGLPVDAEITRIDFLPTVTTVIGSGNTITYTDMQYYNVETGLYEEPTLSYTDRQLWGAAYQGPVIATDSYTTTGQKTVNLYDAVSNPTGEAYNRYLAHPTYLFIGANMAIGDRGYQFQNTESGAGAPILRFTYTGESRRRNWTANN